MDSTLETLLESFKDKRFESYDLFDSYREEILYLYKLRLNDEILKLPFGFWKGEDGLINSRIIIDYIVIEIMNRKLEDIPEILNSKFFKDNMIASLLVYHQTVVELALAVYPGMFNMFDFKMCPKNIWTRPDKYESARKLINYNLEKLRYTFDDIYTVSWAKFFDYNKMANMRNILFEDKNMKVLEFAFEGKEIRKEDIVFVGKWNDDKTCYIAINKVLVKIDKDIDDLVMNDMRRSSYFNMINSRFESFENLVEFYKRYKE